MRFAAGQENGDQTAPSICECVDLRVSPAARAANSLLLLPPFPPDAERCALTCVESIICVSADRPLPTSFRKMTTHILEVAERMADRIGVIAAGRLVAEGTLAELRQQNGRNDTSLEDLFIALVDVEAAA
jgi:hypothetical protein